MRVLQMLAVLGLVCGPGVALADPKIEDVVLCQAGQWAGVTLSNHGGHAAALQNSGSRFVVNIDGNVGPKFDQMINPDGTPYYAGSAGPNGGLRTVPVVFSKEGEHSAYLAKVGDEYIAVADGKEIYRGKYTGSELLNTNLMITTGGKHVLFGAAGDNGGYVIVADGQPGPKSYSMPVVTASPDGEHFAYVGAGFDGQQTPFAVVDGKQVPYFGDNIQYTGKGHLIGIVRGPEEGVITVDGQAGVRARSIIQVWVSPGGGQLIATVVPQDGAPPALSVNGNILPGTDKILVSNVYFSPDDKRYAVLCTSGPVQYVILDGTKGQEYQGISTTPAPNNPISTPLAWSNGIAPGVEVAAEDRAPACPGFTADSSKFLYVAQVGMKYFLVSNEDESDGQSQLFSPVVSADGKHIAYLIPPTPGKPPSAMIDDKPMTFKGRTGGVGPIAFLFSPDGNHYVYNNAGVLFLDGIEQTEYSCQGKFLFSPDSQHLLTFGTPQPAANTTGLFYDTKFVAGDPGVANAMHPVFTPDGKHVYWLGHRPPQTSTDYDSGAVYLDGRPLSIRFNDTDAMIPGNWEVADDGTLTLVARTTGDLHRYRITPGDDTSVDTMQANGK